jgi:CheY-like chemotaxis protein
MLQRTVGRAHFRYRIQVIQKTEDLQPDLILLDIGLPDMGGIEAVERIRQLVPKDQDNLFDGSFGS